MPVAPWECETQPSGGPTARVRTEGGITQEPCERRGEGGVCLACKGAMAAARAARQAEADAARAAELRRQQADTNRRREQEYQRALAAGGDIAAEARWRRLWVETLRSSRFGPCQWASPNGHPGACTRRTSGVYCAKHNRELEREVADQREEQRKENS
jgi:hypothetical protein